MRWELKRAMFFKHLRPVASELQTCLAVDRGEKMPVGAVLEETVRTLLRAMTLAAIAASTAIPASAQQNYPDQLTPTPDTEKAGPRYVLMVLDQPDRDLTQGRTKVNVLVDTKTGKTWLLQYVRKPDSNEVGYVWSEIPFAKAPGE